MKKDSFSGDRFSSPVSSSHGASFGNGLVVVVVVGGSTGLGAWLGVAITTWVHFVEEILPGVHPDLGDARRVLIDNLGDAAGERVGRLVAEDVADVRARQNLQLAAALPHLQSGQRRSSRLSDLVVQHGGRLSRPLIGRPRRQ